MGEFGIGFLPPNGGSGPAEDPATRPGCTGYGIGHFDAACRPCELCSMHQGFGGHMSTFASASTPDEEGRVRFQPDWLQGRGIYGGVPAAAMVHQMARILDRPDCALRSLTVHFCSPIEVGEAWVQAQAVRTGKSVAHMRADLVQDDRIVAYSSASFAAPRNVDLQWQERAMPKVRPAADLQPVPIAEIGGPQFAHFFDYRFGGERLPMTGGDEAILRTWIRPTTPTSIDTGLAVGMLDAMVPAILCRITTPRIMASVDFRIQLFRPLPLPNVAVESHWLLDAHARVLGDGYAEQITWLFSPTGELVGSCQQLIVILG